MKVWIFLIAVLFLTACVQENLPPQPPIPGVSAAGIIGQAVGKISVSKNDRPKWAADIKNTKIKPHILKEGEEVTITIEKPSSVQSTFYAQGVMYYFNKKDNVWQKITANVKDSGKITSTWAKNRAVFKFDANLNKFQVGKNYVVTYWCFDTKEKDDKDNTIWDCNNNRWGLGTFTITRKGFGDVLIESDIGANIFNSSSVEKTVDGTEYVATYHSGSSVDYAKVLKLTNPKDFKEELSKNLPLLKTLWTKMGASCGFYQKSSKTFTWLTDTERVSVISSAQDKIAAYEKKYPSNCRLLDELARISVGGTGFCGDGVLQPQEDCDKTADSKCKNACKPDCSCATIGQKNTGTCGDFIVQQPNSKGFVETCEPPQIRDPITGQVKSGSTCYVRDALKNTIIAKGYCNHKCECIKGEIVLPQCGNGICKGSENYENCPADCPKDNSKPVVTIISPTQNQRINSTVVKYEIKAVDNFGVSSCIVKTDGADLDPMVRGNNSKWSLSKTLSAANHSAQFTCKDSSGASDSKKVMFFTDVANLNITDNTPPKITLSRPIQGSIVNTSKVLLEIKVTDFSNVTSCDAITNGEVTTTLSKSNLIWSGMQFLRDGFKEVRFACTDSQNNTRDRYSNFTVEFSKNNVIQVVNITRNKFTPADFTMNQNNWVRFVNIEDRANSASEVSGKFTTGILREKKQFIDIRLTTVTTYTYRNSLQASTTGRVIVNAK